MNQVLITVEQLDNYFNGENFFIPVLVNGKKWIVNIEVWGTPDDAQCQKMLNAIDLGINLGNLEAHYKLNGPDDLRFEGAMDAVNFERQMAGRSILEI